MSENTTPVEPYIVSNGVKDPNEWAFYIGMNFNDLMKSGFIAYINREHLFPLGYCIKGIRLAPDGSDEAAEFIEIVASPDGRPVKMHEKDEQLSIDRTENFKEWLAAARQCALEKEEAK